eukprot:RCo018994
MASTKDRAAVDASVAWLYAGVAPFHVNTAASPLNRRSSPLHCPASPVSAWIYSLCSCRIISGVSEVRRQNSANPGHSRATTESTLGASHRPSSAAEAKARELRSDPKRVPPKEPLRRREPWLFLESSLRSVSEGPWEEGRMAEKLSLRLFCDPSSFHFKSPLKPPVLVLTDWTREGTSSKPRWVAIFRARVQWLLWEGVAAGGGAQVRGRSPLLPVVGVAVDVPEALWGLNRPRKRFPHGGAVTTSEELGTSEKVSEDISGPHLTPTPTRPRRRNTPAGLWVEEAMQVESPSKGLVEPSSMLGDSTG